MAKRNSGLGLEDGKQSCEMELRAERKQPTRTRLPTATGRVNFWTMPTAAVSSFKRVPSRNRWTPTRSCRASRRKTALPIECRKLKRDTGLTQNRAAANRRLPPLAAAAASEICPASESVDLTGIHAKPGACSIPSLAIQLGYSCLSVGLGRRMFYASLEMTC